MTDTSYNSADSTGMEATEAAAPSVSPTPSRTHASALRFLSGRLLTQLPDPQVAAHADLPPPPPPPPPPPATLGPQKRCVVQQGDGPPGHKLRLAADVLRRCMSFGLLEVGDVSVDDGLSSVLVAVRTPYEPVVLGEDTALSLKGVRGIVRCVAGVLSEFHDAGVRHGAVGEQGFMLKNSDVGNIVLAVPRRLEFSATTHTDMTNLGELLHTLLVCCTDGRSDAAPTRLPCCEELVDDLLSDSPPSAYHLLSNVAWLRLPPVTPARAHQPLLPSRPLPPPTPRSLPQRSATPPVAPPGSGGGGGGAATSPLCVAPLPVDGPSPLWGDAASQGSVSPPGNACRTPSFPAAARGVSASLPPPPTEVGVQATERSSAVVAPPGRLLADAGVQCALHGEAASAAADSRRRNRVRGPPTPLPPSPYSWREQSAHLGSVAPVSRAASAAPATTADDESDSGGGGRGAGCCRDSSGSSRALSPLLPLDAAQHARRAGSTASTFSSAAAAAAAAAAVEALRQHEHPADDSIIVIPRGVLPSHTSHSAGSPSPPLSRTGSPSPALEASACVTTRHIKTPTPSVPSSDPSLTVLCGTVPQMDRNHPPRAQAPPSPPPPLGGGGGGAVWSDTNAEPDVSVIVEVNDAMQPPTAAAAAAGQRRPRLPSPLSTEGKQGRASMLAEIERSLLGMLCRCDAFARDIREERRCSLEPTQSPPPCR